MQASENVWRRKLLFQDEIPDAICMLRNYWERAKLWPKLHWYHITHVLLLPTPSLLAHALALQTFRWWSCSNTNLNYYCKCLKLCQMCKKIFLCWVHFYWVESVFTISTQLSSFLPILNYCGVAVLVSLHWVIQLLPSLSSWVLPKVHFFFRVVLLHCWVVLLLSKIWVTILLRCSNNANNEFHHCWVAK